MAFIIFHVEIGVSYAGHTAVVYISYSIFPFICMYLCTYIRLLCENAIMNPPQTSREGQEGGKEGFRPSGYSGLNQENFLVYIYIYTYIYILV